MKPGRAFFKALALSSSLLLAGGYVWYRAGGSIPYVAPAKLDRPAPPQPSPDEVVVPQEIVNQIQNNPSFLSGSKSGLVDILPQPAEAAQKQSPETLPYPDFEIIDLDKADSRERAILGGSKSSAIDFRRATERETATKTPDTKKLETAIVPAETTAKSEGGSVQGLIQPEIPRVLLPGSKSAFPGIIRDKEKEESFQKGPSQKSEEPRKQQAPKPPEPPQKPEAQQESPPAQTKREFLPGSKSSGFRERN
jgi:hypothetical protein